MYIPRGACSTTRLVPPAIKRMFSICPSGFIRLMYPLLSVALALPASALAQKTQRETETTPVTFEITSAACPNLPAGTTINAIRELENYRVRAAFLSAIEAARDRGRELAAGE